MLSRIFWVGIAGVALVAGIALQDGNRLFSWGHDADVSRHIDRSIDREVDRGMDSGIDAMKDDVDRAIDRGLDGIEVVSDGREIDVPPEMKRAFATAVAGLVEAETDLALLRIRDASNGEREAAAARRDQARAEVNRWKAEIRSREQRPVIERQVRDQIRQEIREDVRDTVRDTVRN